MASRPGAFAKAPPPVVSPWHVPLLRHTFDGFVVGPSMAWRTLRLDGLSPNERPRLARCCCMAAWAPARLI